MTHTTPEQRDQQIAAMLRAGATYKQVSAALGVSNSTIRRVRDRLGIPVPAGRGGARAMTAQERVASTERRHPQAAAMLRAGATHRQVAAACGMSFGSVSQLRHDLRIPVPLGRSGPKGPTPDLAETRRPLDDRIAELLTAGQTSDQIRAELHVGASRVARVRRERAIKPPPRAHRRRPGPLPGQARTIAETLAHHTQPYGDGHARWTGTRRGNQDIICAQGQRIGVRRHNFIAHHQREPDGYVTSNCGQPRCIAGPHLADNRTRNAFTRADTAFEQIFGDAP